MRSFDSYQMLDAACGVSVVDLPLLGPIIRSPYSGGSRLLRERMFESEQMEPANLLKLTTLIRTMLCLDE